MNWHLFLDGIAWFLSVCLGLYILAALIQVITDSKHGTIICLVIVLLCWAWLIAG